MANKGRKIDIAWNALDERYHVVEGALENPFFYLSADDIHEASNHFRGIKFEPRLLTHFDTRQQMPKLFIENGLSVLPKGKGYIIGSFNPFMSVGSDHGSIETRRIAPPEEVESFSHIANEAMGINYAEACGFIKDFIDEGPLRATVSGRHGGGDWTYKIQSKGVLLELSSDKPQIEVDGGYESAGSLILIEAKNKLVEEFCLRQLYFPLRAWKQWVKKPIRTVFLAISGSDYYFYEYSFPEPDVFQAELVRAVHYISDDQAISQAELESIWRTAIVSEPQEKGVTFPQANSIESSMDVIVQIGEGGDADHCVTGNRLAELYGFDDRQGNYYGDTAVYLGFASSRKVGSGKGYFLTGRGKRFLRLDARERKLEFFKALMERPVFHDAYGRYLESGAFPSTKEVVALIDSNRPEINAETTLVRRAGTVSSWLRWIDSLAT